MVPALIVGWVMIAIGVRSALGDARDAHPFALVVHVIAFDVVHDVVVAPLLFLGGWLIGKIVPGFARGPVRAAAAASALFVVFSYPLVRRWGKRPTNSSTLPLEYGRNLVVILAAVWLIAAVVIVRRAIVARHMPPGAWPRLLPAATNDEEVDGGRP
ncbi:MAG: hypothetical protein ABMA25_21535 [Ilumatobacteraceae bacterium]